MRRCAAAVVAWLGAFAGALSVAGCGAARTGPDGTYGGAPLAARTAPASAPAELLLTATEAGLEIEARSAAGALVWSRKLESKVSDGLLPVAEPRSVGSRQGDDDKPSEPQPEGKLTRDGGAVIVYEGELIRLGPDGDSRWARRGAEAGTPALVDDAVVAAIEVDGGRRLAAFDGGGDVRWTAPEHAPPASWRPATARPDGAYVGVGQRVVHVFDGYDGPTTVRHLDARDGHVKVSFAMEADDFSLGDGGMVTLIEERDRPSQWSPSCGGRPLELGPAPGDQAAAPPAVLGMVVFPDGAAVAGAANGVVLGIGADCSLAWSVGLPASVRQIVGWDGGVLALTGDGRMAAISRAGRLRWQRDVPAGLAGASQYGVAATPDGTLLVGGEKRLCAIATGGRLTWCRDSPTDLTQGFVVERGKVVPRAAKTPLLLVGEPPPEGASDPVIETRTVLSFHRQPLAQAHFVAALPNGEVWVIQKVPQLHDIDPWESVTSWQYRSGRWTERGSPNAPMRPGVFARSMHEEHPGFIQQAVGNFAAMQIGQSPAGGAWSLGVRRVYGNRFHGAPRLSRFDGRRWREEPSLRQAFLAGMPRTGALLARGRGPVLLCMNAEVPGKEEAIRCAQHTGAGWTWSTADGTVGCSRGNPCWALRWIDGRAWLGTAEGKLYRLEDGRWAHVPVPLQVRSYERLWGSGADDVWAIVELEKARNRLNLIHWDGRSWSQPAVPLSEPKDVWGSGPDDVWIVGSAGAFHYDGRRWARVRGLPGRLEVVTGRGPDDVWVGGDAGLWHGTALPSADSGSVFAVSTRVPPAARAEPEAWAIDGTDASSYRAERLSLALPGGATMDGAIGVACAADGTAWFHDRSRVVEHRGGRTRLVYEVEPRLVLEELLGHGCLAPTGFGEGWFATAMGIYRVESGRISQAPHDLAFHQAIAAGGSTVWVVGDGEDRALARLGGVWKVAAQLPRAHYAAVDVAGPEDVWLAGGLTSTTDLLRRWPAGEGLVVHYDGRSYHQHRVPSGALLAVAAVGSGQAWAVGAAGTAVQVDHEGARRRQLASRRWLRGVWGSGPRNVWLVGDDATVLRWDGARLAAIELPGIIPTVPFSGVCGAGAGDVWAVGPRGIWRLQSRDAR